MFVVKNRGLPASAIWGISDGRSAQFRIDARIIEDIDISYNLDIINFDIDPP